MILDAWQTENYLKNLAEKQTQIKELVPDSLKENGERRMKEYICKEVPTDNGGYLEPVKELICCKDCRYWPYKSMPYASDEKYTECYTHCFDFVSNGYCYLAEREERRMIDKDEIVVAFMSPKNAKEMSLPDDAQVVTGLLDDDTIIVVPKDEFLDWLFERKEK